MDIDQIELHDARLLGMKIDYVSKSVLVNIEFYSSTESSQRKHASILFEDVESVSQLADLNRLEDHASAGNINYWAPSANGTSYIYLVDGCIAVTAGNIHFNEIQ